MPRKNSMDMKSMDKTDEIKIIQQQTCSNQKVPTPVGFLEIGYAYLSIVL